MTIALALVAILVLLCAFALGVRLGRRRSAIAFGVCLGFAGITSAVAWALNENPHVEASPAVWDVLIGGGIIALLAAVALVGPTVFKSWRLASLVPMAFLASVMAFPGVYWLGGCIMFRMCG